MPSCFLPVDVARGEEKHTAPSCFSDLFDGAGALPWHFPVLACLVFLLLLFGRWSFGCKLRLRASPSSEWTANGAFHFTAPVPASTNILPMTPFIDDSTSIWLCFPFSISGQAHPPEENAVAFPLTSHFARFALLHGWEDSAGISKYSIGIFFFQSVGVGDSFDCINHFRQQFAEPSFSDWLHMACTILGHRSAGPVHQGNPKKPFSINEDDIQGPDT